MKAILPFRKCFFAYPFKEGSSKSGSIQQYIAFDDTYFFEVVTTHIKMNNICACRRHSCINLTCSVEYVVEGGGRL